MESPIQPITNSNVKTMTEDSIRSAINRQAHAYFLTYEMSKRAFAKGFTLVEKDSNVPLKINDKIQKDIKQVLKQYIHGIGAQRAYGHSMFTLQLNEEKLMLQSFEPRDYQIDVDNTGNITTVETTTYLPSGLQAIPTTYTGGELDNTYHSINIPARKLQAGKSYLEPVWEVIMAMDRLAIHSLYFVIRVGAGLFVYEIPADQISDTKFMNNLRNSAQTISADNAVVIIPTIADTEGSAKSDFRIETSNQPIDFSAMLGFYEKYLSTRTGVPRLAFEGSVTGVNIGSEINESAFMDALQQIQDDNDDELRWLIKQIASIRNYALPEDYDILHGTRREISEVDEVALMQQKINLLATLLNNAKLQIDINEAQKLVGIKYAITELEEIPNDGINGQQGFEGQDSDESDPFGNGNPESTDSDSEIPE